MSKHFTLDDLRNSAVAKLNAHLFPEVSKPVKRQKFGNKKIEWEGMLFDSTKEYKRYRELLVMLKLDIIRDLERQVDYELIEAAETEKATVYRADHRYVVVASGDLVVEDVKSIATRKLPDYIMKRKLMLEKHGIKIKEV